VAQARRQVGANGGRDARTEAPCGQAPWPA